MELGLKGRVALVTGSHRGTGSAIARVLAREGARVFVHGFEAGQPDEVVAAIRETGGAAEAVTGDVCSDAGADEVADAVLAAAGHCDVLVNNYGVAEGGTWETTSTAEWVGIYQKNVLSGVRLVQALVPSMRERGFGRVIWLGTIGSTRPNARMPHYYASKAVLPNVCVSLSKELAGSGITVNLVSPGIIATKEVVAHALQRAQKRGLGDDWESAQAAILAEMFPNPTGRLAETEEIGDLVAFLASDRASYINGTQIRIDGGATDAAV